MPSQKVPPVDVDLLTLNINILPAQEVFLVDASAVTRSRNGGSRLTVGSGPGGRQMPLRDAGYRRTTPDAGWGR